MFCRGPIVQPTVKQKCHSAGKNCRDDERRE
jgi:hypothetical protein